ncbi:hypothetical protein BH23ACT11_BH23ACT11_28890 [soil metagenome]
MAIYIGTLFQLGASLLATGILILGIVGVLLLLVTVVNEGQYHRPASDLTPAELDEARREAARRLTDLAPRTLLLSERLREVDELLLDEELGDERWIRVERLTREAPAAGVWRMYWTASALAEDEPLAAMDQLKHIEWMVETALTKLEKARRLCNVAERAS